MKTQRFRVFCYAVCLGSLVGLHDGVALRAAAPRRGMKPRTSAPSPSAKPSQRSNTTTNGKRPNNAAQSVETAAPFDPPPLPKGPPQPQREADSTGATEPKPADAAPRTAASVSADAVRPDADGKYLLRYHFSQGETIRWDVEHRAKMVTSVQGSTQAAETVTLSVKAWKVVETLPGGEAKFVHTVESIDMRQKLTGRGEVRYDSTTDEEVPPIFADAAAQVGKPLTEVTIDCRGNVLHREEKTNRKSDAPTGSITLLLPDRPLAVGESWSTPFELAAPDAEGAVKQVKARHKLTLERIEDGVAVLKTETQILSPIEDAALEAQVVQSEQAGLIRFDLRRGRIIDRTSEQDREVFGFQGADSKLHYTAQFHEKLHAADRDVTAAAGEKQTTR